MSASHTTKRPGGIVLGGISMSDDSTRTDETRTTTDHGTIRNWIESNDLAVARTAETDRSRSDGLTIVTEGRSDDSIKEVTWDEFFETFEDEGLAFTYRTETMGPEEQLYYEFVSRGDVGSATGGTSTAESTGHDTLAKLEGRATGAGSPTGEEPLEAGEVDEEGIVAGEATNRRDTQDDGVGEQADDTPAEGDPESENGGTDGTDSAGEGAPEGDLSDEEPDEGEESDAPPAEEPGEGGAIESEDADPPADEAAEQRDGDEDES